MPIAAKAYTQQELIALIRKGDQLAFSILYDNYSSVLYCVISKACSDINICEEAFQRSFINIWQNMPKFDPSKQRLMAWMLSIARDVTTELQEKQNLNKNSEIQNQINNVPKNKEVLTLIYFKGYSLNKAAEVLNISIEELKVKLKLEFDQLRS